MIKFENVEVTGFDHAIRGARNSYNSWDKSDSFWSEDNTGEAAKREFMVGQNDIDLMKRLCKAGSSHRKFMRMITVYVDVTAPLYWWKEADTYKVGTVANSCSTMHKIAAKEFTLDDFSCEHLTKRALIKLLNDISELNFWRDAFNYKTDEERASLFASADWDDTYVPTKKDCWWQIIQLLPSSYNQRRTLMLNYEVLSAMYHQRKDHRLDEWHRFCDWIKTLPYSELITGEQKESSDER